ncbi:MAG: tetratricopeptide repeat protein, partial [Gammaproteobacteria bacterium]|nr:tetratricopeptide repeat protein [Gammaproteobacteria bacterium]
DTFKIVLALAAAGVGGIIAGTIQIEGSLLKWTVKAGGAMAVFLIVFTITPAQPVQNQFISFEHYKSDLGEKEQEIRGLLVDQALSARDKADLEQQLAEVEKRISEDRDGYLAHIQGLETRIKRLDELVDQVPGKLISEAKQALAEGDNDKADKLFAQIEEQPDPHILAAAESAYQRARLAEDDINYHQAFEHYQRAVGLSPDNPEYLQFAGTMAGIVANHQKQIEWNEKALDLYLQREGDDSAEVAVLRNNMGGVWDALGEYHKAIGLYELALASFKKKLGVDHPNTKKVVGNLALARTELEKQK